MLNRLFDNSGSISKKSAAFCGTAMSGVLMLIVSLPAQAQYTFQTISHPDAVYTQVFGVTNAGKVLGVGQYDDPPGGDFTFVYDMRRGTFTTVSEDFTGIKINNSGAMVGDVDGECAIRDKKGNVEMFYPPSNGIDTECQARGVNSKGNVTGWVLDPNTGMRTGFFHDPKKDTYEEFFTSSSTFANGINARGQVVGHVDLIGDEAYSGSPPGRYGFLRQKDGSVKYFAISQSVPGQTRGRGISDSGLVTGWFYNSANFEGYSYVTSLSKGNAFETVTPPPDEILYRKPCSDDTPSPGPNYLSFTDVYAQQVRNDGVVVGSCVDYQFNPITADLIEYGYGFIATPPNKSKNKK